MPYLLFLGCSLVWSISFLLMKKAVIGFSPATVGAGRVVGGAVALAWLCWRRGAFRRPDRRDLGWVVVAALLGCGWPYVAQPTVVARQGSAFVALTVSLVPLFTIVAGAIVLRTFPTRRQLVGIVGSFLCLAVLLADGVSREIPPTDLLMACSVPLCYACANTLIRRNLSHVAPLWLTFQALSLTTILLVPIASLSPAPANVSAADRVAAIASLAVLGVVGTGLATYWFNTLIQTQGPLFAGMSTNLVPLGAVLWGWADSEQVTAWQLGALIGIVAMVILVQYGAARPAPESPTAGPQSNREPADNSG